MTDSVLEQNKLTYFPLLSPAKRNTRTIISAASPKLTQQFTIMERANMTREWAVTLREHPQNNNKKE